MTTPLHVGLSLASRTIGKIERGVTVLLNNSAEAIVERALADPERAPRWAIGKVVLVVPRR